MGNTVEQDLVTAELLIQEKMYNEVVGFFNNLIEKKDFYTYVEQSQIYLARGKLSYLLSQNNEEHEIGFLKNAIGDYLQTIDLIEGEQETPEIYLTN